MGQNFTYKLTVSLNDLEDYPQDLIAYLVACVLILSVFLIESGIFFVCIRIVINPLAYCQSRQVWLEHNLLSDHQFSNLGGIPRSRIGDKSDLFR